MPSRRDLLTRLGACCALATWPALGRVAAAKTALTDPVIPQRASARVIIDNDFAGDPDGLIALAHQLLTPKTVTRLITSSALAPDLTEPARRGQTAREGAELARELIRRGRMPAVPVVAGAEDFGASPAAGNAAARAIVAEAMRDDALPLFITCGGPLTNIAAALTLEPRVAERATLVWIGGGTYPDGGWEYNLNTDLAAARQVMEQTRMALWQVPQGAYRQMQFSNAALRSRLRTISPFGRWLYAQFTNPPAFIDLGGSWPLGDSPTVLLTALSQESSQSAKMPGRAILPDGRYGAEIPGRLIRVFTTLDARLTFDDFFALLELAP